MHCHNQMLIKCLNRNNITFTLNRIYKYKDQLNYITWSLTLELCFLLYRFNISAVINCTCLLVEQQNVQLSEIHGYVRFDKIWITMVALAITVKANSKCEWRFSIAWEIEFFANRFQPSCTVYLIRLARYSFFFFFFSLFELNACCALIKCHCRVVLFLSKDGQKSKSKDK